MSWWQLESIKDKKPLVKGVWLRHYGSLSGDWAWNNAVRDAIKGAKLMRLADGVERVVVEEYRPKDNHLLLQVWCKNLGDCVRKKRRYNVFYVWVPWDDGFVAEGDLGRVPRCVK